MKIAIVSDTHDNMANIGKAAEWLHKEKIGLILHCGDVCSQDTINGTKKIYTGEIKFAKGNGDFGLDLPDFNEVEIDGLKIGFTHFPEEAKKMAESKKYNAVFYGHTHYPWQAWEGNCLLANPGELAGQYQKPTFAVYETEKRELYLKILEKI